MTTDRPARHDDVSSTGTNPSRGAGGSSPRAGAPSTALGMAMPGQHGAWATLAASFVLGGWGLTGPPGEIALVPPILVGAFVSRYAAARAMRLPPTHVHRGAILGWAVAFGVSALAFAGLLITLWGHVALLPVGALAAALVLASIVMESRRRDRTLVGETVNMIGLTLAVPAAGVVAAHGVTAAIVGAWALTSAFFVPTILRVRHRVRGRRSAGTTLGRRLATGAPSVAATGLGVLLVLLLVPAGLLPRLAFVALLPALAHALVVAVTGPDRSSTVRRVGFEELGHTIVFLALAIPILRRG